MCEWSQACLIILLFIVVAVVACGGISGFRWGKSRCGERMSQFYRERMNQFYPEPVLDEPCKCPKVPLDWEHKIPGAPNTNDSVVLVVPRGGASQVAERICDMVGRNKCGGIGYDDDGQTAMVFGKETPSPIDPVPGWTTVRAL